MCVSNCRSPPLDNRCGLMMKMVTLIIGYYFDDDDDGDNDG